MNWTGGRLSRHSRTANTAVAQRQKKHFARARSNLLNGPSKRSPIKWSLFHAVEPASREAGQKLNSTLRYPRYSPTDLASGLQNTLPKEIRVENTFESTLRDGTTQDVGRLSSDIETSGTSLFNRVSHKDLLHRELPELHEQIDISEVLTGEAPGCNVSGLGADTLEDRRRRILRRIDWVGANIQHPIKLKFVTTGNDERLGKRRKITGRHGSNCGGISRPIVSSTFSATAQKHNPERSPRTRNASSSRFEAPPKSRVRISIGGRHVAAGATSSTNRSKIVGGHLESSQASISDEMLLDGDDINRQHSLLRRESQDRIFHNESSHLAASTVVGTGPFSSPSLAVRLNYSPYRTQAFRSYDESNSAFEHPITTESIGLAETTLATWTQRKSTVEEGPRQINNIHSNGSCHQHDRFVGVVNPNLVTLRSYGKRSSPDSVNCENADPNPVERKRRLSEASSCPRFTSDIHTQYPSTAVRLHSTSHDKLRKHARVYSRPELFHPIPLTSRTSQVLCPPLSESGSTVAQLGIDHIPSQSQLLDEEIWKIWAQSSPRSVINSCEERTGTKVSISPGISELGDRYTTGGRAGMIKDNLRDLGYRPGFIRAHPVSVRDNELPRPKDPADREDERKQEGSAAETHSIAHLNESISVSKAVDYKTLFQQRPLQIPPSPISKPIKPNNPDEAWMKFILSDDNDYDVEGENMKFSENRETFSPITTQIPSQASVIVHLSENSTSGLQREIATSSIIQAMSIPESTIPESTEGGTASFSETGPKISSHATCDSNEPSSDELLSDNTSSIDLIIHREPAPAHLSSTAPSPATQRLIFTKPPRFPSPPDHGREIPETTRAIAGSSSSAMHIGRRSFSKRFDNLSQNRVRDNGRMRRNGRRQEERDIYSREEEYDVESIEDD